MKEIKKIIREEVQKLINEDYESVQELKIFANEVLVLLAKENLKNIIEHSDNIANVPYFIGVTLKSVYDVSQKEYKKLKDFLTNSNVVVFLLAKEHGSPKGQYSVMLNQKYNPHDLHDIRLYYDQVFLKELQNKINTHKEKSWEIKEIDIYTTMYYHFLSILIHELQHAYDDYRSSSKSFHTKEFKKYIEKYYDKEEEFEEYANKQEELESIKKYLQLPHEVWARFSQAMDKTKFSTSGDFIEGEGGKYYVIQEMRPLKAVLHEFFYKFESWAALFAPGNQISKIQRRLIKAVVQFWHKEQERVKAENKNPKYFN